MQRDALAAHKQLLRDQKAHNEKVAPKTPKAKRPADDTVPAADTPAEEPATEETVISPDGAVVTEKAAAAPDVSTLSAEDEVMD